MLTGEKYEYTPRHIQEDMFPTRSSPPLSEQIIGVAFQYRFTYTALEWHSRAQSVAAALFAIISSPRTRLHQSQR
jgi:hypothetical protein